jgi:hypothetical protein
MDATHLQRRRRSRSRLNGGLCSSPCVGLPSGLARPCNPEPQRRFADLREEVYRILDSLAIAVVVRLAGLRLELRSSICDLLVHDFSCIGNVITCIELLQVLPRD